MRFRRLVVGNEAYMNVLSEAKAILDAHGGILGEDSLVAKIINRNICKFTKEELKVILISDFDVTYLKRNKLLYKAFYIEPLFEDLLTKMALYINNYFEKTKKSEDMYEFIAKIKEDFVKEYKDKTGRCFLIPECLLLSAFLKFHPGFCDIQRTLIFLQLHQ